MKLRNIPMIIKLLLLIFTFPIFAIIWYVASARDLAKCLENAKNNPCNDTVYELLRTSKRVIVGINNHPENWQKLREVWYKINGSNRVETQLKKDVLERFKRYGLYVNTKIIDNYKVKV